MRSKKQLLKDLTVGELLIRLKQIRQDYEAVSSVLKELMEESQLVVNSMNAITSKAQTNHQANNNYFDNLSINTSKPVTFSEDDIAIAQKMGGLMSTKRVSRDEIVDLGDNAEVSQPIVSILAPEDDVEEVVLSGVNPE